MIFIGDVHGKIEEYLNLLERRIPEDEESLQVGDMGLGFWGVSLPHLDPRHKWFRGNHDAPEQCRAHENYKGDFGYDPEKKLFWLAGAFSIDRAWRTEGVSWWADEELSLEKLHEAFELYIKVKPEVVVSHECPTIAAEYMLRDLIGPYFQAKRDCANSRTARAMQEMFDVHQPKYWVFGHYHVDKTFELKGTEFRCVAELSTTRIQLPSAESTLEAVSQADGFSG